MTPGLIRLLFVGIWGLLPSVALYGMIIEHLRPPAKTHARQPRPLDRALAFFDPWLCRAVFVVEGDDPLGRRDRLVTMSLEDGRPERQDNCGPCRGSPLR
jgi:hypothetical protein